MGVSEGGVGVRVGSEGSTGRGEGGPNKTGVQEKKRLIWVRVSWREESIRGWRKLSGRGIHVGIGFAKF
jgi:hypothetical protein